jgi:magnesium transporter
MLHRLTAPSPATLSFLRAQIQHAFEPPSTARCAALKGRGSRLASTTTKGRCLDRSIKGQYATIRTIADGCQSKALAFSSPPEPPHLGSSLQCAVSRPSRSRAPTQRHAISTLAPFSCCRTFSTTASNQWKLWPVKKQQRRALPNVSPLSVLMDDGSSTNGLGRVSRPANELKMRCTELDGEGNVTMVSGEFKKTELIAKVCI